MIRNSSIAIGTLLLLCAGPMVSALIIYHPLRVTFLEANQPLSLLSTERGKNELL